LFNPNGEMLVESDGQAPGDLSNLLVQHLSAPPGGATYFLKVEELGDAAGAYTLSTDFDPGPSPAAPVTNAVGRGPLAAITADFNHDGRLDLATANADSNDVSI